MTSSIDKVTTPHGVVTLVTLTNRRGASVTLSSLGAGVTELIVPDALGNLDDVVLGYASPADYMDDGPCAGKIPGRYANRIARGRFSIDGHNYQLTVNNGPNALHGGPTGFQNRIWDVALDDVDNGIVTFCLTSVDGDEHYPGTLSVRAAYRWDDDADTLTLTLEAKTDAPTIVNLTNHSYWNLNGEGSGSVLNHTLRLYADTYTPTDETLVPTGDMAPVEGTPMDFTEPKVIGARINEDFPALRYGKGYDNCWVIKRRQPGEMVKAAELHSDRSGRSLAVWTTQPAVQVYTGNWLAGSPTGKCGRSYNDYDGVAVECQNIPDAPNHPGFPDAVLRPGGKYLQVIEFRFTAE